MQLPRKAAPILTSKARYKVLYGGRASAKSWTVANLLVSAAVDQRKRILCVREYQNSIQESAKHLLERRIEAMGYSDEFPPLNTTIKSKVNGSEFLFYGLRHNVRSIMSLEGIDIVWVEQAEAISKTSWDVLIPTIRKAGSVFYVTFNPELEIDETYQRFIVNPPKDALVIEMGWRDNPWFSKESEAERLDCSDRDPVGYKTIWEGKCRRSVEGSIYGDLLETAHEEGRITSVPVDSALPVLTCWDIGILDPTAIWFFQVTRGGEIHFVDYHEDIDKAMPDYAREMWKKGYTYGSHYGPPDIKAREMGTGKSPYEVAAALGIRFFVVKRIGSAAIREDEAGISVVRSAFDRMWFDERKCKVGLQLLSRYRRGFNATLEVFRPVPVHDSASHCADALRYGMVGYAPKRAPSASPELGVMPTGPSGWMV